MKYFPDVDLPPNLVADSDLTSVVREADILVFCAPHQFMRGLVSSLQGKVCTSVTLYNICRANKIVFTPETVQANSLLEICRCACR